MEDVIALNKTVIPWIARTGKLVELFLTNKFHDESIDLTMKQWVLLKILLENDGDMQNNIAKLTKRNKGSITRIIATLEDKNLVARMPDPNDQRINRVFVTKHGHKTFKATTPLILDAYKKLQHNLSPEEINTLINILKKVLQNIGGSL